MKNKMSPILKWVLFIIIIGGSIYAVYISKKNPIIENKISNSQPKEMVRVVNEKSNIGTYTSSALNVTFQYAIKDPMSGAENKVIEKGNEITTTNKGGVRVYSKSREVSLMDTLKSKMPDCSISLVNKGYGNLSNKNMDIGLLVAYPDGWSGGPIFIGHENSSNYSLSEKDKKCRSQFNAFGLSAEVFLFWGDSQYPDKYIGVIEYPNPSDPNIINGLLKYENALNFSTWEETVKFIPIKKTYTTDLFSVDYPSYLSASEDVYFCDAPDCGPTTNTPFYIFVNQQYKNFGNNDNEVNRIDIFYNKNISKDDLQILNTKEVTFGKNNFITGDSTDWLGGKAYWIQGKGYALRILQRLPKENPKYNGYIDLASLKLK